MVLESFRSLSRTTGQEFWFGSSKNFLKHKLKLHLLSMYISATVSNTMQQDSRWTVNVDKDFALKKPSRHSRVITSSVYRWIHENSGSSPQSPRIPIRRNSSRRLSCSFLSTDSTSSMTSPPRPPVRTYSSDSLCSSSSGFPLCQESWQIMKMIFIGPTIDPSPPWIRMLFLNAF
jgi:hypothetical protein